MKIFLTTSVILLSALPPAWAADSEPEFRFARIIGDGMVLQQEKPIMIWGWAKPGAEVAVTLTQDPAAGGRAVNAALTQGTREAAKPKRGGDDSMTVRYEEKNPPGLTAANNQGEGRCGRPLERDLRSGQGEFPADLDHRRERRADAGGGERADRRDLGLCRPEQHGVGQLQPQGSRGAVGGLPRPALRRLARFLVQAARRRAQQTSGGRSARPRPAEDFSAVPYLYGMFLHRYLKVPVGIINVARGGTTGETWCLREELDGLQHVTVKEALRKLRRRDRHLGRSGEVKRIMAEWEQAKAAAEGRTREEVAEAKAEGKKEPRLRLPKRAGRSAQRLESAGGLVQRHRHADPPPRGARRALLPGREQRLHALDALRAHLPEGSGLLPQGLR